MSPAAGETVAFAAIAIVMLLAGFASAVARRTFHSVMFLGVVLVAAAAYYILLGSAFVGVVQVLVYVGGILTLFIFAVMFVAGDETEEPGAGGAPAPGRLAVVPTLGMPRPFQILLASVVALALFAVIGMAIRATPEFATDAAPAIDANDMGLVTDALFGTLVVPFEVLGILLTAVMFGSLVIARPLTVKGTEESSTSHPNTAVDAPPAPAAPPVPAGVAPAPSAPEGSA